MNQKSYLAIKHQYKKDLSNLLKEAPDHNFKEAVYYLRDRSGNNEKAAVVVLKIGDLYSRGVAICNDTDNYDQKFGLGLARSRALLAIREELTRNGSRIVTEAARQITPSCFDAKAEFLPALTDFELKLLGLYVPEEEKVA